MRRAIHDLPSEPGTSDPGRTGERGAAGQQALPFRDDRAAGARRRWSEDERESLESLLPVIHVELLKVAMALLQRSNDERYEAAGLVRAALIRLSHRHGGKWRSRIEFFRWTAAILRHALVDHARSQRLSADCEVDADPARQVGAALLAVDSALRNLEATEQFHEEFVATSPLSLRRPQALR